MEAEKRRERERAAKSKEIQKKKNMKLKLKWVWREPDGMANDTLNKTSSLKAKMKQTDKTSKNKQHDIEKTGCRIVFSFLVKFGGKELKKKTGKRITLYTN